MLSFPSMSLPNLSMSLLTVLPHPSMSLSHPLMSFPNRNFRRKRFSGFHTAADPSSGHSGVSGTNQFLAVALCQGDWMSL
jgi:hypothetical protein